MTEGKQKQFNFNDITVSFRWVLPIMLGGYLFAYNHDREIQQQQFADIKSNQTDHFMLLKESQDKIWGVISTNTKKTDDRFAYVYQQCCAGAKAAPLQ